MYAYVGYPVTLVLLTWWRPRVDLGGRWDRWPHVTIVVPVYNEAAVIADTLDTLLASDYPEDARSILVVSDASTDGTDDIVRRYADRGVTLHRVPTRRGKTAGENTAAALIDDDIVINTDASVRVHPAAIRHLVAALADPSVGLASACDVSVARVADSATGGESTYVGYEMWVRNLETQLGGIVGASGCLYAVRSSVHRYRLPDGLSRDFAAALVARRRGFRSVSVPGAVCYVPRGAALRQEYRRKVRTMTRGLATLSYARSLLNPFMYGAFSWKLASHKLARWLLPWATIAVVIACLALSAHSALARVATVCTVALVACAIAGWRWSSERGMPGVIAAAAFTAVGLVAGLHAWARVCTGRMAPVWEPTRRPPVASI
jgi:cellulose synthase/poly-beta-1,6-N-acetylglucosamine synthase-like glycosyltransferase